MGFLNVREAMLLMHSYGIKCDRRLVEQWLMEGKLKGIDNEGIYMVEEEEVHEFLEAYRWKGTAYEKGIDDKTKISRLLEEISELRQRIKELEDENLELIEKLPPSEFTPYY